MTSTKPAKVDGEYAGECRDCGKTLRFSILRTTSATGEKEWVRCSDCRTINRIELESAEGLA